MQLLRVYELVEWELGRDSKGEIDPSSAEELHGIDVVGRGVSSTLTACSIPSSR